MVIEVWERSFFSSTQRQGHELMEKKDTEVHAVSPKRESTKNLMSAPQRRQDALHPTSIIQGPKSPPDANDSRRTTRPIVKSKTKPGLKY